MTEAKRYHHGDLRAALLDAAEAELAEAGVEGFSLRKVARRAGVSHAAPAHHFRDARGLLTALAERGYARLVALHDARDPGDGAGAAERLEAYGLAYVDFALRHTALFRLCFASAMPDHGDPALSATAAAAFERLARLVGDRDGRPPFGDAAAMVPAYRAWAVVHGMADLLAAGRMRALAEMPAPEREAALRGMIRAAA